MAGWPGSRRSHSARRIRRRETLSAVAGQLLFIFDAAERGRGRSRRGRRGGRALSGLVRERWAGALGQEERSSCACAIRFLRLPAPTAQIRRSPGRSSLGFQGPTNQGSSWSEPGLRPQPLLLPSTVALGTRRRRQARSRAGSLSWAFSPSELSARAEHLSGNLLCHLLLCPRGRHAAYWPRRSAARLAGKAL